MSTIPAGYQFQQDPVIGESFPVGAITEIIGTRSSGLTDFFYKAVARANIKNEFCAIIDPTDSFNPAYAQNAGIRLNQILWIQTSGNLDAAFKSADYLLHAGGFGIVAMDLADIRPEIVSRIPQAYWFRFRVAVENKRTSFLVISPIPCAGASCSTSIELSPKDIEWSGPPSHRLFKAIHRDIALRKNPKMIRAGQHTWTGRTWSISDLKKAVK